VKNGNKIKSVNGRRKVVPRAEGILVQINYFVFYFYLTPHADNSFDKLSKC